MSNRLPQSKIVFFLALLSLVAFVWSPFFFGNKEVRGDTGNGLSAVYYNNYNFTGAITSRIDSTVNFNWGYSSPSYLMGPNTFSARWTGQLLPKFSEKYTFYTRSDDGVRLWVNNRLIIDNWTKHAPTENSGQIYLAAGQKVNIKMEFYENYGTAVAKLLWRSPSTYKQVIPTDSLFPTVSSLVVSTPTPTQPVPTVTPTPTPLPTPALVQTSGILVPFNQNSIWNKPIGSNPQILSNSSQMIQLLTSTPDRAQIILPGVDQYWSVVVGQADAGTPRYTITDEFGYTISNVPIPSGILLDPTSDAKTVILDNTVPPGRAYSFWALKHNGSGYTSGSTGWGDISQTGDGIHNFDGGNWGGRATGWNYFAGLIRPQEIKQGHIDHALIMSLDGAIVAKNSVWPALLADGYSTDPNAIPEGARLQLDPAIDVNSLPLSPGGKIIAKALQTYGAYLGDTGGATAIYAQEFLYKDSSGQVHLDQSPWQDLLSGSDLLNFPTNRLRVVQVNQADFYVYSSP